MGADTAGKPSRSRQTYEQFKTPEGREAALQRQKKIKERRVIMMGVKLRAYISSISGLNIF